MRVLFSFVPPRDIDETMVIRSYKKSRYSENLLYLDLWRVYDGVNYYDRVLGGLL